MSTKGRCSNCGYTVPSMDDNRSSTTPTMIVSVFTILAVILFIGYLAINIGLLVWSAEFIIPETLAHQELEFINLIFVVIPFPIGVMHLTGQWFTLYYLFLVFSVLASLFYIFYSSRNDFPSYLKDVVKKKFEKIKEENGNTSSPILRLVTVFTALLFFSQTYFILLELVGISPDFPEPPDILWQRVYSLLRASVWEEIIVRFAYIGVPMALYGLLKGKRKSRKYLLGGFGTDENFAVYLVVISSIIFALAHLPGWDIYKMPQTLIPGFAFGYLFIKDGLHSAILLHFFWNFMNVPNDLLNIPNFENFIVLLILFWMGVGVYYTYKYLEMFISWLQERSEIEEKKEIESQKEVEVKDHTAGVTIGYVCQSCGYNKAEYTDEGKLRCTRCGTKSDPKSPQVHQQKKLLQSGKWPPS